MIRLDVPHTTLWSNEDVAKGQEMGYEMGLVIVVGPLLRCTLDALLERAESSSNRQTTEQVLFTVPLVPTGHNSRSQPVPISLSNHGSIQERRPKDSPNFQKCCSRQCRQTIRHPKQSDRTCILDRQESFICYQQHD
jgi:hypothetical protein